MTINIYQVDAFTDKVFAGNPAAVCPLDAWLQMCFLARSVNFPVHHAPEIILP